jgi:hypothetical protein
MTRPRSTLFRDGRCDQAGFVQVIQGHTDDLERAASLGPGQEGTMAREAPHIGRLDQCSTSSREGSGRQGSNCRGSRRLCAAGTLSWFWIQRRGSRWVGDSLRRCRWRPCRLCSSPWAWWSAACCCWPCWCGWPPWGGATGGGPGGDGGSVAVDGVCEPGRGSEPGGVRGGVGQAVEERSWQQPAGWASGQDRQECETAGMPRPLPAWFPGPVLG